MNLSFGSAFFNPSATWFSLGTYSRSTDPMACCSLKEWCWIAMCLVLAWNCRFLARAILVVAKNIVALGSCLSSKGYDRSDRNQIASLVACVCAMYSASQVERDTVGCRFDDQLIDSLPMLKRNPDVGSSSLRIAGPVRVGVSQKWL